MNVWSEILQRHRMNAENLLLETCQTVPSTSQISYAERKCVRELDARLVTIMSRILDFYLAGRRTGRLVAARIGRFGAYVPRAFVAAASSRPRCLRAFRQVGIAKPRSRSGQTSWTARK